MSLHVELFLLW